MARRLAALLVGAALLIATVPSVEATTIWSARFSDRGLATLRVGVPTRLVLGLTGFRAGTTWTITLRRGSCASLGALVLSTRVTASSAGRISGTIRLTTAQTRAARLPLALRFGTRCAPFVAQVGVFGDGTWRVGVAPAVPGTYRTEGGPSCYWERLSGFGGTFAEIIANDIGSGPRVVTISATDAGFKSSRCGTWRLNAPAVPTASPADGIWRVGADVVPGTYRTEGGPSCYWERLSGFGGTFAEIIANDIGSGPRVVTIDPADIGFESSRCGTWRLNAPAVPTTSPADGIWRVGADVVPGTYRTEGGPSCYWARLSGFGGTSAEIIANDIGSGPRVVTIDPADIGFESSGCGTWQPGS